MDVITDQQCVEVAPGLGTGEEDKEEVEEKVPQCHWLKMDNSQQKRLTVPLDTVQVSTYGMYSYHYVQRIHESANGMSHPTYIPLKLY